jgi:hypothetical protein
MSDEIPTEEDRKAANKARIMALLDKDPVAAVELVEGLMSSGKAQGELDRKTDAEVADLVSKLEEAFELTVFSPFSVLIQNAAERLRRADGGPTYTAEDHIEAERAREAVEAKSK